MRKLHPDVMLAHFDYEDPGPDDVPRSLQVGMSLTRDLTNTQGVLILAAGQRLGPSLVAKLQSMESAGRTMVYVMNDDEATE